MTLSSQNVRVALAAVALSVTLLTSLAAQSSKKDKPPRWRTDPYTKNEPKLLEKLGYVSYGPFEFGQRGKKPVTSDVIDEFLEEYEQQILWVETEHLRIGSALEAWSVPIDRTVREALRVELEQLRESGITKFPKKAPRQLDPWLRLHLLAQRMENHYALIEDWLGVKDAKFPNSPADVIIGEGEYMGQGPYLGQTGKYLIFVTEEEKPMNEYLKAFMGRDTEYGQRWNYKEVGSLFYGIASEMEGGRLKDDRAMHANLVFNLTHNLIDGYRFYSYETPVWIKEGLGHYFERLISPRYNTFDANEGSPASARNTWKWEPEMRKLLANRKYSPFSEAYKWRDYGQINFDDHVAIWSRWDYLMAQGKEKFGKFMKYVKGRIDSKTWLPDDTNLVEATREALQEVYGISPLSFDERWADWVKENYSTR